MYLPQANITRTDKSFGATTADESSSASSSSSCTLTGRKTSIPKQQQHQQQLQQQHQQQPSTKSWFTTTIPFHIHVALILGSNVLAYFYLCTTTCCRSSSNNSLIGKTVIDYHHNYWVSSSSSDNIIMISPPPQVEKKNVVPVAMGHIRQKLEQQGETEVAGLLLSSHEHSFGYFTDISNDEWRRFYQQPIQREQQQQHHDVMLIAAPNGSYWKQERKSSNGKMNSDVLDAQWLYHNYNPNFVCPHAKKIGDPGGKWMCDPERFYTLLRRLQDEEEEQQQYPEEQLRNVSLLSRINLHHRRRLPCLIYSVGSKGNFRWEDDIIDVVLQGRSDLCEIHIFDPFPLSQYYKNVNELQQIETHLFDRNMYYHAWGWIGTFTKTTRPTRRARGNNKANFKTLPETRRILGHDDGLLMLDILKLDCEGCEWETSFDWLNDDSIHIQHLLLESHSLPWSDQIRRTAYYGPFPVLDVVHDFFERLLRVQPHSPPLLPASPSQEAQLLAHHEESVFKGDNDGTFVLYSKEVNTHRGEGRCVEWSFLRLHRDFFTK